MRRYAWIFDIAITLTLCALAVYGTIHYNRPFILPWTYIITMIAAPVWIILRTYTATHYAADLHHRQEASLTLRPANQFVNRRMMPSIILALLPIALLIPEAVAITIKEGSAFQFHPVLLQLSVTLCGIAFALAAVWENLIFLTAKAADKSGALRRLFIWNVCAFLSPVIIICQNFLRVPEFPVYALLFTPIVISAGPLLVRHRYRAAIAQYFDFE